jgi:hypothetical protein
MDPGCPPLWGPLRQRFVRLRRYAFHDVPMVGRSHGARQDRGAVGGAHEKKRLKQWIWGAPPAGSPTSWDGKTHRGDMGRYRGGDIELAQWIGRYGPGAVLCGHVHQSPFRPGGAVARPHRIDLGVQCRASVRAAADPHHPGFHIGPRFGSPRPAISRCGSVRRESVSNDQAAGLAHAHGPGARSDPGLNSSYCRQIRLCRTSSTIAR